MDFDRHDYGSNPYSLNAIGVGGSGGNSAGMNDISALAAAASDQLYELERHEAFRRAEYELRHRQIAGSRSKSNGGSPAGGTPANFGGAYGFSNERDRWGAHGVPTATGGTLVYPMSAAQPATTNHPAIPAGTLADPTYLIPPTCCHEDCHKSYRKRLKVAKQTQACPNCLTGAHGANSAGQGGMGGAGQGHGPSGGGAGSDHHSDSSNTPKDRSNVNSAEDLTKLGGGGGAAAGGNSYALHHSLHQQLARLQQHHLALQMTPSLVNPYRPMAAPVAVPHQIKPYTHELHAHKGMVSSAHPSRAASPDSDDSSDEDPMPSTSFEFTPASSPVLAGMRHMSLFQKRVKTAPTSAATSPIHSKNPSRAGSPVDGHNATSGKHGHGSHQARDAKHRSHPYTHFSSTTPNSPHFAPTKARMSPPKLSRSLSGSHTNRPSVEDILNSSVIPPPPPHSDRTLPPPHSSSSFSSSVPSVSYSLSSQPTSTHASPNTSRASSPVHSTHPHATHNHNHNHSAYAHSHLAHSVRAAFGMTPIAHGTSAHSTTISPSHLANHNIGGGHGGPHKLAPMSFGGGGDQSKVALPSFSRGSSPMHLMKMEVDGHA